MRVLYSFPDTLGLSGIGVTAYHQVESAASKGIDVLPVCTSARTGPRGARNPIRTLQLGSVRIPHRAIGWERAYVYHDARAARLLRRMATEVDLVHTWPKACLRTAAAARGLGIPVVREAPSTHTAFMFERVAEETSRLGIPPVKGHSHSPDPARLAQEEAEYDSVDFILVPSAYSKRTFLERGVSEEKLLLHQYGVDGRLFHHAERARDRTGYRLTALFAGRAEPVKGLHYALRAWIDSGAASTGRFLIYGDFTPRYREALSPWVDHPSVEYRGVTSDLGSALRSSDLLILPSLAEGSALVTYEAQACGCVPVVSEAAGARCEHMRQGLVHQPGDVETLTGHIRLLYEDRELLARLRRQAIESLPRLTWDHAGVELAERYRDCVRRRNGH